MIHFVGAGPGALDLITLRGMRLLRGAGMIVYAGSLVNTEFLTCAPPDCEAHNSASMTLDEVIKTMQDGFTRGLSVVRLHTGDPSLYGAVREQMERLKTLGIPFEIVPGVSSFCAAAAALHAEYTLPGVSQTLIITRMEGRTPVPEREKIQNLAVYGASMAVFLSAGMVRELCQALTESGGYSAGTPAALVYKASWPEEKILRGTLATLPEQAEGIRKTALILVGNFLGGSCEMSRLYDASFSHEFRKAKNEEISPETQTPAGLADAPPVVFAAFTRQGAELASRLSGVIGEGRVFVPERFAGEGRETFPGTVSAWAGEWFPRSRALVFISAAGIAVRAIAPHLRNKAADPAVVVLDDAGRSVVSLLSGHIGGGNDLARKIAALTGGNAVVTTATDTHRIEAADDWAAKNGCFVENPTAIKSVSAAMLEGLPVGVAVTDEVFEEMPPPWPVTLWLRPRVLVLGVGCKRGTAKEALDAAAEDFLRGAGRSPLSLKAVASINLKRSEPAILDFCRKHGPVPFLTYSAEELNRVEGPFFSSQRVLEVTGVDNVCERAAVLASGGGPLLRGKTIYPGIALALARCKP
ncbi:MAG: precorrin-4 C(11)-methyltransferase [Synergistaceae bacterium]|jgi:precorrin-4 C11-methyltransferase|nr:precorrin-4 C(11)-methyltransferase [Synergistaceae bacterium]